MHKPLKNPSSDRYEWLKQNHVVRLLETIQDLIVISLCIGLFGFMVLQLRAMFLSLLPPLNFHEVTADILFILILVELFRLLIIYLQEHRISIGVAVEVAIVSVLRESIVRGVLETPWSQTLSACAFLLVMGVLLVVRVWIPPTFNGIDPEQRFSLRNKGLSTDKPSELTDNSTQLLPQVTNTPLLSPSVENKNEAFVPLAFSAQSRFFDLKTQPLQSQYSQLFNGRSGMGRGVHKSEDG